MLRLYVLLPHEYAHELEPDRALGSIEENIAEEFGQEATVVAWEVCDGAAPDALLPPTMMKAAKAVAEKGAMNPFLADEKGEGQTATYATLECPPPHRVGVVVFSDKRLKKHHRWHHRRKPAAHRDKALDEFEDAYRGCIQHVEGGRATFDTACMVEAVKSHKDGARRFVESRCKDAEHDHVALQSAVVVAMAYQFVFHDSAVLKLVVDRAGELNALDELRSATEPWAGAEAGGGARPG